MNLDFWSTIPRVSQNLFLGGILLFALSTYLFFTEKKGVLLTLGTCAFLIASSFALAIPWLYIWDEQFHALVGKNLASNPFHPILINLNPELLTNETWADHKTWLHKQPLFLYQIAITIKIIGNSAFAVRLPSIIFHVIGVITLFDMGRIMLNKKLGFITASLFLFSFYPLGLLSGRIGTDHNDSVFMIYILLSFWAYFKYTENPSKKWSNWIGLFVGLAILTKWLVGLLVFAPWGIFVLIEIIRKVEKNSIWHLLRALLISFILVLPWQIYIHYYFPIEANFEMHYNTRHFFEALEGHGGNWKFHFDNLWFTFFSPKILLLLLNISLGAIYLSKKNNQLYWSMWIATIVLFTFFTISKTKMYSFIIPSYPLVLLIISFGVVKVTDLIKNIIFRPIMYSIIGCFLLMKVFKPERAIAELGFDSKKDMYTNRILYQQQLDFILKNGTNDNNTVVINADLRGHGNISWSFFTENKAIHNIPSKEQIKQFKKIGYKIKCIQWNDPLPAYILSDKSIEILPFE